jgi:flagellar biosynthesis protein FlhF
MQIKRIKALDNKAAFKQAVELFGKDAVILSSRDTRNGVEVVAADRLPTNRQYIPTNEHFDDEEFVSNSSVKHDIAAIKCLLQEQLSSLIWDNKQRKQPIQAQVIRHLFKCGFSSELAEQVASDLVMYQDLHSVDFNIVWPKIIQQLKNYFSHGELGDIQDPGIYAFHGAPGSGKTSAIVKIASQYAMYKGVKDLVIISLDIDRVGKLEEIQIYGRILNVPIYSAHNEREIGEILRDSLKNKIVLLDVGELRPDFFKNMEGIKHILVLEANLQLYALRQLVNEFKNIKISGTIVTKIDLHPRLGETISALISSDLMPIYTSSGTQIPDSLQIVNLENFITKSLNILSFTEDHSDDHATSRKYTEVYLNESYDE